MKEMVVKTVAQMQMLYPWLGEFQFHGEFKAVVSGFVELSRRVDIIEEGNCGIQRKIIITQKR